MAEERVQRKLAAILAADVVGYSGLMGEDEAGTLAALKAHREELIDPAISEYQGRIVKLMGDGLLVEFTSVVNALECAVAIQRGMPKRNVEVPKHRHIVYRIGVNLSDIIIDGDDIFGNGVNVAARLEGLAEPGGICLSDAAYQQIKGKTDLLFHDLGEKQLKNIPEKVRAHAINLDPARLTPEAFKALTGDRLELPDKPSIAVLPFENMSDDPEQEFVADGMSEDIIAMLSSVPGLVVMARNSTFVYKGRAINVPQVGRELGVRYVLEGSLRKAGNRVRVTAQLIDALSGDHVWAERYNRKLDDIFALQDEITRETVVALSVNLTAGEEARIWSAQWGSFEAWEFGTRALVANTMFTKEDNREADRLVRKAISLDPDSEMPKIMLGWVLMVGARWGFLSDPETAIAEAETLVGDVLAQNFDSAAAHALNGNIHLTRLRFEEAITAYKRSIELAPGMAMNHGMLAYTLQCNGDYAQCLVRIRKAMRLSPYFADWYLGPLGEGYRGTGALEKARDVYEHFVVRLPRSTLSLTGLARVYTELGESAKAHRVAENVLSIDPEFSVARFVGNLPYRRVTDREEFKTGLLEAGLPE